MSTEPFIGEIRLFGFGFAPVNYVTAQGQTLSIAQNSALFALYGTTYGGNGQSTFQLPNLGGRVVTGQGQAPGASRTYQMGETTGSEQVTLNTNQLPAHSHAFTGTGSVNAIQTKGTDQAPDVGSLLARAVDGNRSTNALPQIYVPAGTAGTTVPLGGVSVTGTSGLTGGNQPVSIMQPYLTMNYCVATVGIFPSRN